MTGFLTVLAVWIGVSVLVAAAWSATARMLAGTRRSLSQRARLRRRLTRSQAAVLLAALAVAALSSAAEQWRPLPLVFLLGALALASDAVPVTIGRYRFTGSFMALVLAMALLGPAPAVAIALTCASVDALRHRPAAPFLLNNLATWAAYPLAGALLLAPVDGEVTLALACLVVALAVHLLNFVMIAGFGSAYYGDSLRRAFRTSFLPVLEWELAIAAIAAATVYGYLVLGAGVVAAFALTLPVVQLVAARMAAAASSPDRMAPSM